MTQHFNSKITTKATKSRQSRDYRDSKITTKATKSRQYGASSVCGAKAVVAIITPAVKEPSSRLNPSLSLHWKYTSAIS
ncbi:hypothetical protein P8452_42565 [Trifolium repens]|jgi:hypothetical protein|nr:hypothetical protein P8452_42565 [Trifolium repens]